MKGELRVVIAMARRDIRIMLRHPLNTLSLGVMPVYQWLVPGLLLGAAFLVRGRAVGFAHSTGTADVAGFLAIGAAVGLMSGSIFWGITSVVQTERDGGTLEITWASPVRRDSMVFGSTLALVVLSGVAGAALLALAHLLGAQYAWAPVLTLSALALYVLMLVPLAYLVTSLVFLLRGEANYLMDVANLLLTIGSGALFPLALVPEPARVLAFLLPVTLPLDILRGALLHTRPLLPAGWEYVVLVLVAALLLPLTRWVFLRTERRLLERGTLSQH